MAGKIKKLNADETSYFCYQMASVINSGIPIFDGLTVFASELDESGSTDAQSLISAIADEMSLEKPLHEAMAATGVFPEYCVAMVKAGEKSGNLHETLSALSEHYENEAELSENIKNAVLQPIIMMMIMASVILILVFAILPMFSRIFADFAPDIASQISRSIALASGIGIGMLAFCAVMAVFAIVFMTSLSSNSSSKFASVFPVTKKYARAAAAARFCGVMTMMTKSGIDTISALDSAYEACTDPYTAAKIDECRKLVVDNVPFVEALEKTKILNVFDTRTLKLSYTSGTFDEAWSRINGKLSREANDRLESIISTTEPVLTGALTALSGIIMLTVMVPLMDIMNVIS